MGQDSLQVDSPKPYVLTWLKFHDMATQRISTRSLLELWENRVSGNFQIYLVVLTLATFTSQEVGDIVILDSEKFGTLELKTIPSLFRCIQSHHKKIPKDMVNSSLLARFGCSYKGNDRPEEEHQVAVCDSVRRGVAIARSGMYDAELHCFEFE